MADAISRHFSFYPLDNRARGVEHLWVSGRQSTRDRKHWLTLLRRVAFSMADLNFYPSRNGGAAAAVAGSLGQSTMTKPAADRHLFVRAGGKVLGLALAEIEWIEADRNYVLVHAAGITHKVRDTLARLTGLPALAEFVQIHRSILVNKARVKVIHARTNSDWEATLESGAVLKVGRRYLEHVRNHLRPKLHLAPADEGWRRDTHSA